MNWQLAEFLGPEWPPGHLRVTTEDWTGCKTKFSVLWHWLRQRLTQVLAETSRFCESPQPQRASSASGALSAAETAFDSAPHLNTQLPDTKACCPPWDATQIHGTASQTPRCGGRALHEFDFCRKSWINPKKNPHGKSRCQTQVSRRIMVAYLRRPSWAGMSHSTSQSRLCHPSRSSLRGFGISEG